MSDKLTTDEQGRPERIYLQLFGDSAPSDGRVDYMAGDVTWCWHPIYEHDVEYVRADIAASLEGVRVSVEDAEAILDYAECAEHARDPETDRSGSAALDRLRTAIEQGGEG